jgi:hypothetical protein
MKKNTLMHLWRNLTHPFSKSKSIVPAPLKTDPLLKPIPLLKPVPPTVLKPSPPEYISPIYQSLIPNKTLINTTPAKKDHDDDDDNNTSLNETYSITPIVYPSRDELLEEWFRIVNGVTPLTKLHTFQCVKCMGYFETNVISTLPHRIRTPPILLDYRGLSNSTIFLMILNKVCEGAPDDRKRRWLDVCSHFENVVRKRKLSSDVVVREKEPKHTIPLKNEASNLDLEISVTDAEGVQKKIKVLKSFLIFIEALKQDNHEKMLQFVRAMFYKPLLAKNEYYHNKDDEFKAHLSYFYEKKDGVLNTFTQTAKYFIKLIHEQWYLDRLQKRVKFYKKTVQNIFDQDLGFMKTVHLFEEIFHNVFF